MADWLAESQRWSVFGATVAVFGTMKRAPLNDPGVAKAGAAGLVVTRRVPTFTVVMVSRREPLASQNTVSPGHRAYWIPSSSHVRAAGFRLKTLSTVTHPSVTDRR